MYWHTSFCEKFFTFVIRGGSGACDKIFDSL